MSAFSTAERADFVAKGWAEADGSYPIRTGHPEDIRNAVSDYNRSNGSATDKAHIIARARSMGRIDLLPNSWVEYNYRRIGHR